MPPRFGASPGSALDIGHQQQALELVDRLRAGDEGRRYLRYVASGMP